MVWLVRDPAVVGDRSQGKIVDLKSVVIAIIIMIIIIIMMMMMMMMMKKIKI